MVVSTSLMTGAMSLSAAVSLSIESVSSGFSSSPTTSSAKPSVTSSSTRCDCSVFLSRSEICESVATLTRSFLCSSSASSSISVEVARIGQRDFERPVLRLHRHEVVAEHQVHRDGPEQIVIDRGFAQIDELAAIARGDRLRRRGFSGRIEHTGAFGCHRGRVGFRQP